MVPYSWQYLPLFMQILAVILLGVGMVVGSYFVGRHRNTATKLAAYECGIVAVGDARGRGGLAGGAGGGVVWMRSTSVFISLACW